MNSNDLRVLALSVQRFGANSEDAKSTLENSNFGMNRNLSLVVQAQALALYLNTKKYVN